MKHFCSNLCIFCLMLCLLAVSVSAKDTVYDLEELDMSVAIPNTLITFTRNIEDNDPNLAAYGLAKDDLAALMQEQNVYLNAFDEDVRYEVIITMTENSIEDFNLLSDTTLTSLLMPFIETEYEDAGITMIDSDIYQHSQAKFMKVYISQPNDGNTVYSLQYYTVYNSQAINFTLHSYSGAIDSNEETILKAIVDSAHFNTEPQTRAPATHSDSFTYTDQKSGASFVVPQDWVEVPFSDERNVLTAKFAPTSEPETSIIFMSYDFLEDIPEADRYQYSRATVDNSFLTKADVSEIVGCDIDNISMISFAGKEYYYATHTTSEVIYEIPVSISATNLIRCENGYVYMFMFTGDQSSQYYDDFKSLINSVTYPAPESSFSSTYKKDFSNYFNPLNLIISLVITILLYSAPIIVYRYAILKKPIDKKKAKWITIIYGFVAVIIMSIILYTTTNNVASGSAVFFWSFINYRMLTSGQHQETFSPPQPLIVKGENNLVTDEPISHESDTPDADESIPPADTASSRQQSKICFCRKCGRELSDNRQFCGYCGTKVMTGDENEMS